ncbi:hypothetical protein L291_3213 [Acinetobacter guillouiae MSP4-18]|uniref:hypothetical protein n=1 Tax=Acinetobacter guillouiae TaxID=106649 RepID=UPI0002D0AA48|nr:hypothetical protein [Acinetobacter guillouiae]ENU56885.1 hypothetical protein F981_04020 [Acinetobacter guillouiae CIP 63.46]EPH32554.1 hypothetical protein L291_3213 [Acinetobacter guillouiae MSP4-18]KAB0623943.1 hypothetical protein F7P82_19095 [Acinetobacter guillouiae]
MGTVVATQHILQAIDWSRFDLEGWLYQFGAWLYTNTGPTGKSVNPIAVAMDNAVKAKKYKKLNAEQKLKIIAGYMLGDFEQPKPRKTRLTCEINDNEARAVQRLILDLQGQSEILDDWMDAIICRYFYGNSWPEMVTAERTQNDARSDVKCGLAALHSRYSFIKF